MKSLSHTLLQLSGFGLLSGIGLCLYAGQKMDLMGLLLLGMLAVAGSALVGLVGIVVYVVERRRIRAFGPHGPLR